MNILSTGSIYLDINTQLEGAHSNIGPEKEYISTSYETVLGGSAVIAPLVMAKLGLTPHFVGVVGSDDFGRLVKEKLDNSGIKPHLEQNPKAQTNVGINRIDEQGKTYMDVLGNANSQLTAETLNNVIDAEFKNLDLLYLGSIFKTPKIHESLISSAKKFKEAGKLVFLDHGRVPSSLSREEIDQVLGRLLPHITHYAPSEEDIKSAWDLNSVGELISLLTNKYPNLITQVKMGAKGSIIISKSESTEIPVYGKIDLSTNPNFIGAGDTSNAGFIYGLSKMMSSVQSAHMASHTAYLHITRQQISELALS